MNKFNEIYSAIEKRYKNVTDIEADFILSSTDDNYEVITEDVLKILNEYVSNPELTPIPKEFLNFICSKVKFRRDNVVSISMSELYSLLREYEYPHYEKFKNSLKQFTGNLYIVLLFDRDFSFSETPELYGFNKTYSFLLNTIKDEKICKNICKELLKPKLKNVDAFCSKTDNDLKNNEFFLNNGLIFISLRREFLKDSLEHELTHFIQKTVGIEQLITDISLNNTLNSFENKDIQSFYRLIGWLKTNITTNIEKIDRLSQFFAVKFASTELHQSIKAVLNGFQRIYEFNKFGYLYELDFPTSEINKKEAKNDINFRLLWLNKFLEIINTKEFIKNNLKPVILNLFESEEQQQYLIKYRPYFILLLYFGFNEMFKKLKINDKLLEHFKTFNYKDN